MEGLCPKLPVKTDWVQTATAPVKHKAIDIMKRQLPSQLLEERFLGLATRRALLSDSIRLGAQLMLQKAVELKVTEFLSLSTVACAHLTIFQRCWHG